MTTMTKITVLKRKLLAIVDSLERKHSRERYCVTVLKEKNDAMTRLWATEGDFDIDLVEIKKVERSIADFEKIRAKTSLGISNLYIDKFACQKELKEAIEAYPVWRRVLDNLKKFELLFN